MGILLLLENHDKMTARSLAEHFEVSVRTIYRDIEVLSEAGYSIFCESGRDGGISLLDSQRIQISAMDEKELIKLSQKFALNSNTDILDKNIALKIRSQLSDSSKDIFDTIQNTTLIDNTSWYGYTSLDNTYMELLQKAIIEKLCLYIDYSSFKESTLDRKIHPLGLCKKNNKWYLVAFCEVRNDYRVFRLSRIQNPILTEEHYTSHSNFDIKSFWENSIKNFNESSTQKYVTSPVSKEPLYLVKLELSKPKLSILSGFDLLSFNENIYEVDMISEDIAFSQLTLNNDVTILSPQSLIDKITSHAENILKKYVK